MTAVADRVLTWLYSSLKPEYQDPHRAYTDIAKALSQNNSLSPRTETYTYENGVTALLLQLHGNLPVTFRNNTYKFPIILWIPHQYPQQAPMLYVIPTQDMVVRPSQHISTEGRVYHPYLAHWSSHWDKSSIVDFLSIVKDIFAVEPPLSSRQQQFSPPARNGSNQANGPPLPQPPPSQGFVRSRPSSSQPQSTGPRPPPKPGSRSELDASPAIPVQQQHHVSTIPGPPSLPPKIGPSRDRQTITSPPSTQQTDPGHNSRYASPLPLPPHMEYRKDQHISTNNIYASNSYHSSGIPEQSAVKLPNNLQQYAPPILHTRNDPRLSYQPQANSRQALPAFIPNNSQTPDFMVPSNTQPSIAKQPATDLLSGPLEIILPQQNAQKMDIPLPPIPPNPEKNALLAAFSSTLRSKIDSGISQNKTAASALEAQHGALQQAYHRMKLEMSQLQQLDLVLSSNEKILHEAMREADRVMESVGQKEKPNVDEVLVAPTVVGEQLYGLVADERSISEAMFLLTRALDRGSIRGDVFVKQTRTLAREQFLKKALIRKIARGMGLATQEY